MKTWKLGHILNSQKTVLSVATYKFSIVSILDKIDHMP